MPAAARRGTLRGVEHAFSVHCEWLEGRQVVVGAPGKRPLRVAAPPAYDPDADPAVWSPEDLLCSALATCVGVTLTGQAAKRDVPIVDLSISVTGVVDRSFTGFEVAIDFVTEPGFEEPAEICVERAKHCLVGSALDVPVRYAARTRELSR